MCANHQSHHQWADIVVANPGLAGDPSMIQRSGKTIAGIAILVLIYIYNIILESSAFTFTEIIIKSSLRKPKLSLITL